MYKIFPLISPSSQIPGAWVKEEITKMAVSFHDDSHRKMVTNKQQLRLLFWAPKTWFLHII
jgi:hypothetical protein